MSPDSAILVKTFNDATAADLAACQLRSRGIECQIVCDDGGGMYPPLGVIKLFVDPAAAEGAREILGVPPPPPDLPVPSVVDRRVSPPVFRFNSGLIVGVILGALSYFGYTKYKEQSSGGMQYDNDKDGTFDEEEIWKNGETIQMRKDRNADGRMDIWTHFREGIISHEDADDNFDGQADSWFVYTSRGVLDRAEVDADFNGVRDVTTYYIHGIAAQSDWKPNGTNVVLVRQFMRHGGLREELRDDDGDGRFDVIIKFDDFANPIGTNWMNKPVPAGQ